MVLGRIRNVLLGKRDGVHGDLYIGGDVLLRGCEVSTDLNGIVFVLGERRMEFPLRELTFLERGEGRLSFVWKRQKYVFRSEGDLRVLYESVVPLAGACEIVYEGKARYGIYNGASGMFEDVSGEVGVYIIREEIFLLKIASEDAVLHFEELRTETQYYMDQGKMTFVWSVGREGVFQTFSLRFSGNVGFLEFLSKYVGSLYRNVNRGAMEDDAERYFERMERENYVGREEMADEEYEEEKRNEEEYESCDDDELENGFGEAEEKNKHLVVGNEMAFVTRGRSVGVFRNARNGLEFCANIGDAIGDDVAKIITHDGCSSLVYLDRNERDRLQKLDVERGEVVETWEVGRNVNDYFDSQKLMDGGTLVGVSDYSVFRIDPRTKERVVESKEYKTKNEFCCGAATGAGHVAVASRKGDLRLYDKIDKRAKSLLPGFGDEIKHVDVTRDGKHVLCTCKNYLMLTSVSGDYKQAVGKDKPVPKRLQLKPEHLVYINEEVDFTPAKFSTDDAEGSIVTSTGSYVVKWSLRDVLAGKLYSYQLAKCNDLVVADNFEFREDNNVIVTMPDDVRRVSVQSLRKPGRGLWK